MGLFQLIAPLLAEVRQADVVTDDVVTLSWSSIAAIATIASLMAGLIAAYLRLVVLRAVDERISGLSKKFMPRELLEERFKSLEHELHRMESPKALDRLQALIGRLERERL